MARNRALVASSVNDAVAGDAAEAFFKAAGDLDRFAGELAFNFDHVTAKPLAREGWLAHATALRHPRGDWILLTALPEAQYLAGVRASNSRSAMVFALALLVCLALATLLAAIVSTPLGRIARAA